MDLTRTLAFSTDKIVSFTDRLQLTELGRSCHLAHSDCVHCRIAKDKINHVVGISPFRTANDETQFVGFLIHAAMMPTASGSMPM